MKNKIILVLTLAVAICCVFTTSVFATAETEIPEAENTSKVFTVTFNSNGGSEVASVTIDEMGKIQAPEAPIREGYEFAGWYHNHEVWNFDEHIVYDDITLTAQWTKNQGIDFGFDFGALIRTSEFDGNTIQSPLAMMGLGMAGIFVVTLVIVGVVLLLNKLNLGEKKDNN